MTGLLAIGNGVLQVLVAFISTIAFAVIFHAPKKELFYTGLTGGAGWLVYLLAQGLGRGTVAASFLAARALA